MTIIAEFWGQSAVRHVFRNLVLYKLYLLTKSFVEWLSIIWRTNNIIGKDTILKCMKVYAVDGVNIIVHNKRDDENTALEWNITE